MDDDPTDTAQDRVVRQSIRDAVSQRTIEERRMREVAAKTARQQVRKERADARLKTRITRVTAQKKARVAALARSREKVQSHLAAASRELQRALRAAQNVPLHRHSPEGREQLRVVRNLTEAMGAVKAAGKSSYYSSEGVDLDFDDFDVGAVD